MTLSFDLYWSVRSPYSYLATPRLFELCRDFDVSCRVRPVYPHAMRDPDALQKRGELWLGYFKRDIVRTAAFLSLPLRWPNPDPVAVDGATGRALPEQPLARRLTHLIAAAAETGQGLPFVHELSAILWSPTAPDWTVPGVLEGVCDRAGLALDDLESDITARSDHFEAIVRNNDRDEHVAGHWGVPVMVFDDEPFFGQDRIDQLTWRMRAKGLKPKSHSYSDSPISKKSTNS